MTVCVTYAVIGAPATSMHVVIPVRMMCVIVITIVMTHSHVAAGRITHVVCLRCTVAATICTIVSIVGISAVLATVGMHLRRMVIATGHHVIIVG